jgi:hypothetical protein
MKNGNKTLSIFNRSLNILSTPIRVLFPFIWTLNSYFQCYLRQIFIKYYKILVFSLNFFFKFFGYKIFKLLLINFLNIKVIYIFIYYYINLKLFVKNLGKFLYNHYFDIYI